MAKTTPAAKKATTPSWTTALVSAAPVYAADSELVVEVTTLSLRATAVVELASLYPPVATTTVMDDVDEVVTVASPPAEPAADDEGEDEEKGGERVEVVVDC